VCPKAERVYVFPTERGLKAISSGRYPFVNGYQDGIKTATAGGYLVPPFDIELCVGIALRPTVWSALSWSDAKDADALRWKGKQATALVMGMLKRGLFPIQALGTEIDDADLQIDGTDIVVKAGAIRQQDIIIQVKCDLPGGEKPGGSGNLYLQTEECNPFQVY